MRETEINPQTDPSQPFSLRFPIRFTHTDPAGYVFFPRFFDMFQAVSEDWFTYRLGLKFSEMIMVQQVGQPTAFVECQFIKPCVLGDDLDMAIVLEKFGTSSLDLRYVGTVAGEVRLCARSVQVLINFSDGKPVAFSDKVREKLTAYHRDVIPPDVPLPARRK